MLKRFIKRKWLRRTIRLLLIGFVLLNIIACFHAYKFTHFSKADKLRTADAKELSTAQKISTLFFGIDNPHPVNKHLPDTSYQTIFINSTRKLECWNIPVDSSKGTVILFHGFAGFKSSLLERAKQFRMAGYSTMLVDFLGSGGSEGNTTTIGYDEAKQVKDCVDYVTAKGEKNIYLFGTSMGAAAIMKAIHDQLVKPKAIILECPFGTMYKTVCARFKMMHAPTFPMAGLLVFWGGTLNGFWAFGHNPQEYAKSIDCPTLLLFGAKDDRVSIEETNTIYQNLAGKKELKVYPNAGHDIYVEEYREAWRNDVFEFLLNN